MYDEQIISVHGMTTRVLTAGHHAAPPLVLLHDGGWGASADCSWNQMIPWLQERYRVIAPDMLGFGGSEKVVFFAQSVIDFRFEHILDLLTQLGVPGAAHFVGSSFGGTISVQALTREQWSPRIRSVVSIGGTGGPWKTPKALAEMPRCDGTREGMRRYVGLLGIDEDDDEYVERRLAWAHTPGHYEAMTAPHIDVPSTFPRPAPLPSSFPDTLRHATAPLLLISGEHDDLLEADWASHLVEAHPDAREVRLASGHCPNVSMPSETAAVVDEFIASEVAAVPAPAA